MGWKKEAIRVIANALNIRRLNYETSESIIDKMLEFQLNFSSEESAKYRAKFTEKIMPEDQICLANAGFLCDKNLIIPCEVPI